MRALRRPSSSDDAEAGVGRSPGPGSRPCRRRRARGRRAGRSGRSRTARRRCSSRCCRPGRAGRCRSRRGWRRRRSSSGQPQVGPLRSSRRLWSFRATLPYSATIEAWTRSVPSSAFQYRTLPLGQHGDAARGRLADRDVVLVRDAARAGGLAADRGLRRTAALKRADRARRAVRDLERRARGGPSLGSRQPLSCALCRRRPARRALTATRKRDAATGSTALRPPP